MKRLYYILLAGIAILFAGCAEVKPYQRVYLNDEEMQLVDKKIQSYGSSIDTYREGSSGGNGGKTGGGCGCN